MTKVSATVWVHVFEEDTADVRVFRPEDAAIPLSRRPRQRLELRPDGSATLSTPGADDRPVPQPARWTEEDGEIVVRDARNEVKLRVVERSADRLVARRPT